MGALVVTLARLRTFVALADTGSVRAAAERLVVTEPAVSAAVTALGHDVGVPLVERVGRGVRLTNAGMVYADHARRVLGLLDAGASAARGESDPEAGEVRLAAVTTAADHLLPDLLAGFRAAHATVGLRLEVGSSDRVWALLERHEADLAIGGRPPPGLAVSVRAVRANTLIVVGAPALAAGWDPARATWLMREPGSRTRTACEALLSALDLDPHRLTLGSNGAVSAGAAAGLGVTLVSRDAVAADLDQGRLVVLDLPSTPLRRRWHVVTHPYMSSSTGLLIEHMIARADGWRRPRYGRAPRQVARP